MKSNSFPLPKNISERPLVVLAAGIIAASALASCGIGTSADGDTAPTLTVATWKGYGADLPWVAQEFKKETGANLRFQYIDSEQNMLQLVERSNGAIDVALPNLQYLKSGVDKGLFAPLDTSKLTNYANVYPALSSRTELRVNDKLYAVPWVWGSSGIFYNADKISASPTSWSDLWSPTVKGKVALYDDSTILAPIAGMHLGEDPNNPEMTKVGPALKSLAASTKLVFASADDLAKALSSGSVDIGVTDAGMVGSLAQSGVANLKFVLPKEGGMGWVDNWAIVEKSRQHDLGYQWLNFMTSPDVLARWANDPEAGAPTPANSVAISKLVPKTRERLQTDPTKLAELHLQLPLPPARLQSWADAWQQAKAG